MTLEAAAEGSAGEIVRRPDRLPRYEEIATRRTQGRPLRKIRHGRRAQEHAVALDDGRSFRGAETKKRHGVRLANSASGVRPVTAV